MALNLIALAIGALLFTTALVFILRPKPDNTIEPGELESPSIKEGEPIPICFGTCWFRNPAVVWFGDRRVVAVKSKGGKK